MENNSLPGSGQMPTTTKPSKNIFIILGAVVVLATLLFLGIKYFFNEKEVIVPVEEKPEVTISPVEAQNLPEKFPANFPLEKDVPINANYNAEASGSFQSTRQFISKKTLAENYKLYTDYLKKDGWTITATLDTEDVKSIFAQKGRVSITITMNKNSMSGENTVDISFVYR